MIVPTKTLEALFDCGNGTIFKYNMNFKILLENILGFA
jgi:hypothetical protein